MRPSPSATCPRSSTTSARRPRALAWCVHPPQSDLGPRRFPVMGLRKRFCFPPPTTRGLALLVASRPGGATSRYRAMTADPRTFSSPNLTRSDASSPPVSTQSGWCHQVGSHLAAHDPTQASRHLQCDWRYHDHSHGRARHQARELHRLHPGSRREGEFTTRNPDRGLGAPDRRASPRPKNKLRTPHAANLAAGACPTCDSPPPFTPFFQQEMPDIDALDRENPLAVTEYVNDIFSYWFRVEVRRPTSHRFIRRARRRWLSCRQLF